MRAQRLQLAEGRVVLHALDDHLHAEAAADRQRRRQDGLAALADVGGEAAVDLDRIGRHALQVGERGIAGAEIVDRDPHAARVQRVHRRQHLVGIAREHRLGELELQRRRRHAAEAQRVVDMGEEGVVQQLLHRDVDRDRAGALAHQAARLHAGAAQHPVAEARHLAALLGQRDELRRRHLAELRVVPAQQCLERTHAAALQVDDRLEVQLEAVGVDRLAQRGQHAEALLGAPRGVGPEQAAGATAEQLGLVRRDAGVAHRRLGVARLAGHVRDADADQRPQQGVAVRDRDAEHGDQHVGDGAEPRRVGIRRRQQHRELVAGPACQAQRALALLLQPARHRHDHVVAGDLALGAVDLAQVVQVQQQQRARTVLGAHGGELLAEARAAREAGLHVEVDQLGGEAAPDAAVIDAVLPRAFDCRGDRLVQLRGRAGLGEEAVDLSLVDRRARRADVGLAGEQDARGAWCHAARLGQQPGAAHAGHAHVRDHHVDRRIALEQPQRIGAVGRAEHLVVAPELQLQAAQHLGLVVDAQYALSWHAGLSAGRGAP
ncbi:MAG: hypothetical protein U1F06_00130 [Steroidobacteraceae bacterium]